MTSEHSSWSFGRLLQSFMKQLLLDCARSMWYVWMDVCDPTPIPPALCSKSPGQMLFVWDPRAPMLKSLAIRLTTLCQGLLCLMFPSWLGPPCQLGGVWTSPKHHLTNWLGPLLVPLVLAQVPWETDGKRLDMQEIYWEKYLWENWERSQGNLGKASDCNVCLTFVKERKERLSGSNLHCSAILRKFGNASEESFSQNFEFHTFQEWAFLSISVPSHWL